MFRTIVTISLLQVVLGLLHPLHPVFDLQINLRPLKMVPNDFPYPKTWGLKKQVSSLPRSGVTPWRAPPPPQTFDDDFRHHNDVFVLLHHVFWVGLCLNNPDHAKNWRKNQNQSLRSWVTPRSTPWPPTARPVCSEPSGQSEGSENGPKWFPIPKNLGFKKKPGL